MVKNRKLISVGEDASEKLTKRYESESPKVSFAEWVSEYLLVNLEKDEFLSKYAPHIHKIGITDNVLYLKDTKKDRVVEIRLVNNTFQCNNDDPIYLQFAMALLDITKLKGND